MIAEYNFKKLSLTYRQEYKIGLTEAVNTKDLLKKMNIIAVFRDLDSDFSGMTINIDGTVFMLINSRHTTGRQNFTIAHEIYHIYCNDYNKDVICADDICIKNKSEENADKFASYLLLPEDGLLTLISESELSINKISLKTILEIENYYKVSRSALLKRLLNMKLIDKEYSQKFYNNIKSEALINGYDISLYESGNHNLVIGNYAELAKNLYDKKVISESNFMSFLADIGINKQVK